MMKKLAFFGLLVFLCPFAMGAGAAEPSNTLNLSTDMFGLHGPFSLTTIYSKTFGLILEGKYTQLLDQTNAISVELDGGKAERRIGATWGHILTPNQRFKITAERLSQKRDFSFDSGNVSTWVYQNALGGSYEYLLSHNLIKAINLNAFYSKANSKDLPYKDYMKDGSMFRNYRRIAGATDKSVSTGIDLSPVKSTLVGLQLNYDNVKYNTRYEKSLSDDSGLGATITLHQLVNQRVQFNLLASDRKPYKDYQAEVDWLVNNVPGSQLQLGLVGERIDGSHGLPNDNRVGLKLSYSWGGDNSAQPVTFSDPMPNNNAGGLRDWTATPAVHMEQVLAIKDQKSVALTSPVPTPSKKNGDTFHYNAARYGDGPIEFTEMAGQPISNMSFGDESDPHSPLIVNSGYRSSVYPVAFTLQDTTTYQQGYTPKSKLTVTAKQWSEKKHGVQDYNYTLTINGTPVAADFDHANNHSITFNIVGTLQGYSPTTTAVAQFILKQGKVVKPTITINPEIENALTAGKAVPLGTWIADVKANAGKVDPSSIKTEPGLDNSHNVTLKTSECAGKTECKVYLGSEGDVTNPTFDPDKTQITFYAGNTTDGKASQTFNLIVKGAPEVINDDLGSKQAEAGGAAVTLVANLKDNFNNPLESGDISYQFKDAQGNLIDSKYGLKVENGKLVAQVPLDEKLVPGEDIYIWVHNDIGQAIKAAKFHLTVTLPSPIIMNPYDKIYNVDKIVKNDMVMDIKTTQADIDPDSIKIISGGDIVMRYALVARVVKRSSHECLFCLTSDPKVTGAGWITHYKVIAKDKAGHSATCTFTITVPGK